jgi:transposase-like protein
MLSFKRMRFPVDVILLCICWYAAYPLSYRHLEEMMDERGVSVDHSTANGSVALLNVSRTFSCRLWRLLPHIESDWTSLF